MAITLTYWKDPRVKHTEDDFDSIFTIQLKSVKQIPDLVAQRPKGCTMISTERSAPVKLKNGKHEIYFKIIWQKGDPIPEQKKPKCCALCGRAL